MVSNKTNSNNIYNYQHTPNLVVDKSLKLQNGTIINKPIIAYQTYGKLNSAKSNAILICHALTGDQYAAGIHPITLKKGWWNDMIGKGKVFDTNSYYIICTNVLGGCMGTTGPKSKNPKTGEYFGNNFPEVSIKDMVALQKKLIDYLNIKKLLCVVGGSMGGMQVLEWATTYPDYVKLAIPIATSYRHTAQNIAFHEVGRQAIKNDPNWSGGDYIKNAKTPEKGLAAARMVAHITYMSEKSLSNKFGRNKKNLNPLSEIFEGSFEVENYLQYQGSSFVSRFDANSYLHLTRCMDQFDLSEKYEGKLEKVFKNNTCKWLIISFNSDWLFPTSESKQLVSALNANACNVSFVEIESDRGHDSFLLHIPRLYNIIRGFLIGAKLK
jgi:homoserine O-acetyltransferase